MTTEMDRRIATGRIVLRGYLVAVLLLCTVGAWSVYTEIAGAVVASGVVQAEGNRQPVQHIDGGVIGSIAVNVGDRVAQDDVLITLDDTFLKSDRALLVHQISEITARQTRLYAERDGDAEMTVPAIDNFVVDTQLFDDQLAGQRKLFKARQTTREGEAAALNEQIGQTKAEISGLDAQLTAVIRQLELVTETTNAQAQLLSKGLTTADRVRQLQIEEALLRGQEGALIAQIAGRHRQINETRLQLSQLGSDVREAAIAELRDLSVSDRQLRERLKVVDTQLSRLDIRAPVSGVVHDFDINSPGSVLRPAEQILEIVPDSGRTVISVEVDAVHVDEIHVGQEATLRLTALSQRITPELNATVTHVSADAFVQERTGQLFYEVELLPDTEATPAPSLVPGMPVDAFIETAPRTPLAYFLQPMTDYLRRALREV